MTTFKKDNDSDLETAEYGWRVLKGVEKICRIIDAQHPEYWQQLTDIEFMQEGGTNQYLIDALKLDVDKFMKFTEAWEENVGDAMDDNAFYMWPIAWRNRTWENDFVTPWKRYVSLIRRTRGLDPTVDETAQKKHAKTQLGESSGDSVERIKQLMRYK